MKEAVLHGLLFCIYRHLRSSIGSCGSICYCRFRSVGPQSLRLSMRNSNANPRKQFVTETVILMKQSKSDNCCLAVRNITILW